MSKLLFVTLDFPPAHGGVSRMYQQLCRAMPPEEIVVWAPPAPSYHDDEPYPVRRAALLGQWWPRWVRTIFALRRYLQEQGLTDVIVGQVLPLGTAVWILARFSPIRYAVFAHGMDISWPIRSPRKRWVVRKVLRGATAVLAANRYVGDLVISLGVPAKRVRAVRPWPTLRPPAKAAAVDAVRNQYGLGPGPIIVTLGRLVERKGHAVVLRSLERVWSVVPDARYFIIGNGPMRARLKTLAATLTRPEQVHFVGAVPDETAAAWLSVADVFVMTPRTMPDGDIEGFGIVYLEAGAFGKPVVGTRHGGVPEAVVDGETGLLVPENDTAATAAAIITLLQDSGLRERLGAAGQRRVRVDTTSQAAEVVRAAFSRSI